MSSLRRRIPIPPQPPETQTMSSSGDFSGPGREQPRPTRNFPISRIAVVAPQLVWMMTIVLGMATYRGNYGSSDTSSYLPLAWYDGIFIHVGPLLPLIPLATRAMASFLSGASNMTKDVSPARAGIVYVLAALIRLTVYFAARVFGGDAMSDHVFLGACVFSAAHAEAVAGLALLARLVVMKSTVFATISAAMVVLQSLCLIGLQCGDSWFTAIYFHMPGETMVSLVLGMLTCQALTMALVIAPAASALELAVMALRESRDIGGRLG